MRTFTIKHDHPFVGKETCRACHELIKAGDEVVMVPLGPGKDDEQRARMLSGLVYTAVCAIVHADCAHRSV